MPGFAGKVLQENLARGYAKQPPSGGYQTSLPPELQSQFLQWVKNNKVPYDPSPTADYDMPGFYLRLLRGEAQTEINANDGRLHYDDVSKTPYHASFSNESMYANSEIAPRWINDHQLVDPRTGEIVFDEKRKTRLGKR